MNCTTEVESTKATEAVALYLRGFIAPLIPAAVTSLVALFLL